MAKEAISLEDLRKHDKYHKGIADRIWNWFLAMFCEENNFTGRVEINFVNGRLTEIKEMKPTKSFLQTGDYKLEGMRNEKGNYPRLKKRVI